MAQWLSSKSWEDIQQEMSIAGDAEKVVSVGKELLDLIIKRIDMKNLPEIDNMEFALQRVIAELKVYRRNEFARQHPREQLKRRTTNFHKK